MTTGVRGSEAEEISYRYVNLLYIYIYLYICFCFCFCFEAQRILASALRIHRRQGRAEKSVQRLTHPGGERMVAGPWW